MTLRAIQEFVVHFQSFRNVDLWYQGAYLLKIQIFFEGKDSKQAEKTYAHPFAHTENYFPGEEERIAYDSQIIKPASMHTTSSSFLSKAFLLRYYEEEVELNDLCHFRVETDLSTAQQQFTLQVSLLFYDQQIKKVDPEEITVEKGKVAKTKRFVIRNTKAGIHECMQVVFEGQYYSVANLTLHSVCIDYRFRQCPLQLFQFSRMSNAEKRKLLDKNKKMQSKSINLMESITAQLKLANNLESIQTIEDLLIKQIKRAYHFLLKEYSSLFSRVVTEHHRQAFSNLLINPSELGLFEEEAHYRGSTWLQRIYKRYKSNIGQQIVEKILDETNLVSGELLKLWHHYIDLIKISPRFTIAHYQEVFHHQQTAFWEKLSKTSLTVTHDICLSTPQQDNQAEYEKDLTQVRNKLTLDNNVINEEWIIKKSTFPLVVQTIYQSSAAKEFKKILPSQQFSQKSSQSQSKSDYKEQSIDNSVSLHLIVLVHGFQGNSLDMKLIKNNFSVLYPQASFLCATSNEELTDNDIIEMGARLATEIKNHLIEFFPPDTLRHISFVGHSLGGVIIRAALPRLLELKNKFHSFITFASPHLGYKVNTSSVIEAGIWVLQKLKSNNCLKQLTMADHSNPRQSCLYRLSKYQGIKYFQHIFLFSSKQDSYAPFESARIQIDPNFMDAKDPLKDIHCQMVRNILAGVEAQALHRLDVSFTIEQTNLDSLIGRTAHILFLESSELMQMFLHTRPFLFG